MQRRLIVWMIALETVIAAQNSSHAAGAIAVGVPADVARDGAEFQVSFNFKTTAEAIERALSKCRAGTSSATKLCKIMATFNNHCGAEALDPQPGTPGFGWALAAAGRRPRIWQWLIAGVPPVHRARMPARSLPSDATGRQKSRPPSNSN